MRASNFEIGRGRSRKLALLSPILGFALMLSSSIGCGPPSTPQDTPSGSGNDLPVITDDVINERINEAWIRDVPEEKGIAAPISWNFDFDEPKEIVVVDKQVNGPRATIVLDIKTSSAPRAKAKRQLSGQIRTEWELRTGWVMRRWEIVRSENISMKYKDLPAPPAANNSPAASPVNQRPQ
jgi:hypothetical protein